MFREMRIGWWTIYPKTLIVASFQVDIWPMNLRCLFLKTLPLRRELHSCADLTMKLVSIEDDGLFHLRDQFSSLEPQPTWDRW